MHNQDFEKSVQQRMEELSFTPSASVWDKVQADIRPQNRRRVALWFLPLALLIGTGGWWLLQQDLGRDATASKGNTKVSVDAPPTNTSINGNENQSATVSGTISKGTHSINGTNLNAEQYSTEQTTSVAIAKKSSIAQAAQQESKATNATNGIASFNRSVFQPEANNVVHTEVPTASINLGQTIAADGSTMNRSIEAFPLLDGNIHRQPLIVKGSKQMNALLHKNEKEIGNRSGWQWGAQVHYGFANIRSSNLVGRPVSADFSNAGPWPSQGGGGAAFRGPNPQTERGTFLAAGITVQRAIGRGVALGTGIQYESYSQRQGVGEAINRSTLPGNTNADALQGNVFYRDQNKNGYFHNKVQLVSVPLLVHLKPLRRVPLELIAGVHAGYIVAAKSLQYDTASRLYYAARPQVSKVQVAGIAAAQYTIAERGGWQLLGGPQVQYGINRLNKEGAVPQRLYAYSLGLQLRRK